MVGVANFLFTYFPIQPFNLILLFHTHPPSALRASGTFPHREGHSGRRNVPIIKVNRDGWSCELPIHLFSIQPFNLILLFHTHPPSALRASGTFAHREGHSGRRNVPILAANCYGWAHAPLISYLTIQPFNHLTIQPTRPFSHLFPPQGLRGNLEKSGLRFCTKASRPS